MNISKRTPSEHAAFWKQRVEQWYETGLLQAAYSQQAAVTAPRLGCQINKDKQKSQQNVNFICWHY